MYKALVVNCTRNGLGVIRSLGAKGVKVFAVDHSSQLGMYSKYVNKRTILPSLDADEMGFLQGIIDIGKSNIEGGKIFLFPVNDIYVFFFCKHWSVLKEYYVPVFEVNSDILSVNINKLAMYDAAERSGVPYPKSVYNYREVEDLDFPVIIKPDQKRPDDAANNVFRIAICENKLEAVEKSKILESSSVPYVIQEYIEGGDDSLYTAGVWVKDGELKAICGCRKLRQFPPSIGQCSYGELVDATDLVEIVKQFVAESQITGICQLEFKKNGDTFYLMEINPRAWSWNSLTTYAGVNLPWIALQDLAGVKMDADIVRQSKLKGTWMFVEQDIYYNILKSKNVGLLKWVWQFLTTTKYAHFDIRDPRPYLVWLKTIVKRF